MNKENLCSKILFMVLYFLFASGCTHTEVGTETENISEFEKMFSGFPECEIYGVYLDPVKKNPVHSYFNSRNLIPSKVDSDFAYFIIDEDFYGIKVRQIMIPASTYSVHSLYLKESISDVKIKLKKYFPHGFYTSEDKDFGEKPILIEDPGRKDWSILSCSPKAD